MRKASLDLWTDADRMLRGELTPEECATKREVSAGWMRDVLRVAEKTQGGGLPEVSVRAYAGLLKRHTTVQSANRELRSAGPRLRDVSCPMESTSAIERQLALRSERGTLGDLATAIELLVAIARSNGQPTQAPIGSSP